MRALLSLLLLAAVAHAGWNAADAPDATPDASASRASLRSAIDGYLRESECEAFVPPGASPASARLSAPASGGVAGWISLRVNYWIPSLDGEFASTDFGQLIDVRTDLGLNDEEGTVVPEVILSLGGVGIRFDFFSVSFEGSSTLNRSFSFAGFTFTVNEDVQTHVQIDNYRLLSQIPLAKLGFVAVSLQAGISYFDLSGRITGATTGTASEAAALPIPVLGLLGQVKVGRFMIEVDATGFITAGLDVVDASTFDLTASVGVSLFKVVAVRAGYRIIRLDGEASGFEVDATMDGFFVGASLNF